MPNAKIGDVAILAEHSLVTADVKPISMVGGNLSELLMKRFEEEKTKNSPETR